MIDEDIMRLILANVRSHDERRGDFQAQIGSLKTGATRLLEIVERRGQREAADYAHHLIEYSAQTHATRDRDRFPTAFTVLKTRWTTMV